MLFPTDDEFSIDIAKFAAALQERTYTLQQKHRAKDAQQATAFKTRIIAASLLVAFFTTWFTRLLQMGLQRVSFTAILAPYIAIEVVFFFWQRRRWHVVNELVADLPETVPGLPLTRIIANYLLAHDVPLDEFITGWFHGAQLDQILRDNMTEFLAYGLFYSKLTDLDSEEQQHLYTLLEFVERKLGKKFPPGYNQQLSFMAHLWQPLRTVHLPLCVYAVTELLGFVADGLLLLMGFRLASVDGFRYFVSPAPRSKKGTVQPPVLFLHGVLGLIGCIPFIWRLYKRQHGKRAMVVLDIRHVSMRLSFTGARTADEVAEAAAQAVFKEGYSKAHVVAHSYGTFVAARLTKSHAEMLQSLTLMEPVALLTCWPNLLSTFVYSGPTLDLVPSIKSLVGNLRWLCSREQTMAQTFCRRFFWSELTIWPQELPNHTLIVLAENDDLVASELVKKLCAAVGKGKVLARELGSHGDVLLHFPWQLLVIEAIGSFIDKSV